jgi:hypothetical protein
MRRMKARTVAAAGTLAGLLALVACGGGAKAPGTCPAGTVLKGSDCLPGDDSSGDDSTAGSSSGGSGASGGGDDSSSGSSAPSSSAGASSGGDTSAPAGKAPYDKDHVDVQLKRAARQIKGNCGAATDENGTAAGPWGSTKATVVLGRNGHVKQVTVPSPYDGKPVGLCVVHAFQKIQFPPYNAPSDSVVDWDVEITQPGK